MTITIPQGMAPIVSGYSQGAPGGVDRVDVAGGRGRFVTNWDRGTQQHACRLVLDKLQYSVWSAFYLYSIAKGALAFAMPLDSGLGLRPHVVNVVPGSYSVSHEGGALVFIDFTVETTSGVYALSDAQVAAEVAVNGLTPLAIPLGLSPVVSGYGHGGIPGSMRGDVAGSFGQFGQDWMGGVQDFTCTIILTPAQMRIWTIWFYRLVRKGGLSFDMPLDSGLGLVPHLVTVLPGSYSVTRNGEISIVSFSVEAESTLYTLGRAGAESLLAIYAENGIETAALLARLAQFAVVDSLVLDF
jgi:hypothetical protein